MDISLNGFVDINCRGKRNKKIVYIRQNWQILCDHLNKGKRLKKSFDNVV